MNGKWKYFSLQISQDAEEKKAHSNGGVKNDHKYC